MERMELRLLSLTLSRPCISASFLGKVLEPKTNLILLGKWPTSSPAVRRPVFAYFRCCLSNCRLANFHSWRSFKFWILGELQSVNFGFWVTFLRSSLWTWNQKSYFPHFLSLPTVTSQVLFPTIMGQFSRSLCDYEGWKTAISAFQFFWNFRICLVYT